MAESVAEAAAILRSVEEKTTKEPTAKFEQWALHVLGFSTQYGAARDNWGAEGVIGEPRCYPNYGDQPKAWACQSYNSTGDYIILQYETAVLISAVEIYETFNPGAIVKIQALDMICLNVPVDAKAKLTLPAQPVWIDIYTSEPVPAPAVSRIFIPQLTKTDITSRVIRIETDCKKWPSWYEIDAVKLIGSAGAITHHSPPSVSSFGKCLSPYLYTSRFSDVTFVVQDRNTELVAHGIILASRSPVFASMLSASPSVNRLVIPEIPYNIFKLLLEYIYTESVQIDSAADALWLHYAAFKYQISELLTFTQPHILVAVTLENAMKLFQLVQDLPVRDGLLRYMAVNLRLLSENGSLSQLTHQQLLDLMAIVADKLK